MKGEQKNFIKRIVFTYKVIDFFENLGKIMLFNILLLSFFVLLKLIIK